MDPTLGFREQDPVYAEEGGSITMGADWANSLWARSFEYVLQAH